MRLGRSAYALHGGCLLGAGLKRASTRGSIGCGRSSRRCTRRGSRGKALLRSAYRDHGRAGDRLGRARMTYSFARKGGYRRRRRLSLGGHCALGCGPCGGSCLPSSSSRGSRTRSSSLCLPVWAAARNGARPFGVTDGIATAPLRRLPRGRDARGSRQWDFHQRKKAASDRGEPLSPPFLTTGLFRYSRHPNFFFEMALWWSLALFSVRAAGRLRWLGLRPDRSR